MCSSSSPEWNGGTAGSCNPGRMSGHEQCCHRTEDSACRVAEIVRARVYLAEKRRRWGRWHPPTQGVRRPRRQAAPQTARHWHLHSTFMGRQLQLQNQGSSDGLVSGPQVMNTEASFLPTKTPGKTSNIIQHLRAITAGSDVEVVT